MFDGIIFLFLISYSSGSNGTSPGSSGGDGGNGGSGGDGGNGGDVRIELLFRNYNILMETGASNFRAEMEVLFN